MKSSEETHEQVGAINDKLVALTDDRGQVFGNFLRVVISRSVERFDERWKSDDLNTGRLITQNEIKIEIVDRVIDKILSRAEVRSDENNDNSDKEKLRKFSDDLRENDW